jgi:hypothetical protein
MVAPAAATSAAECGCLPGFGISNPSNPGAGCAVCPADTYSPGGTVEACVPCGFGLTSPASSSSITDCYPLNQICPPGMEIPGGGTGSSTEECQCKPGFGKPVVVTVHSVFIIGGAQSRLPVTVSTHQEIFSLCMMCRRERTDHDSLGAHNNEGRSFSTIVQVATCCTHSHSSQDV